MRGHNAIQSERALRRRIRFLIPTPIAVLMIVAYGFMSSDFAATGAWHPFAWVWAFNALLVWNILARERLQKRLQRLLEGRCPTCGYDLTGNISGVCPECGTPIKPA